MKVQHPNPPKPDQIDLSQPVDWSHPQARGLVAYYPFWLRQQFASPRDVLNRFVLEPYFGVVPTVARDGVMTSMNSTAAWYFNLTTPVAAYPFTLAAWANVNNATANHVTMELHDTGGSIKGAYLAFSGASGGDPVEAIVMNGSYGVAASTKAFVAGQWQHGCGVFTSSTLRSAFCNGSGKGTNTTNLACTPTRMIVRAYFDSINPAIVMAGKLGDARVYNRALSDAETYALWHPSTRWAMLRTLTGRRTFYVPAAPPTGNRRRRFLIGAA